MKEAKNWLALMRFPFLVLTPPCVLLGVAVALWTHSHVSLWQVVLVLVAALAGHISVNALNEYMDFRTGVDLQTEQTPLSGGSGTLRAQPQLAPLALGIGLGSLGLTSVIGLHFMLVRGWWLLPVGLLGAALVLFYTPWITRIAAICAVATGLGFGTVMVNGTAFALTGTYTWAAFVASLGPFFLLNALLLINHMPDAEIDKQMGRRNLPILLGRKRAGAVYGLFLLGVYLSLGLGVAVQVLPPLSLLGLLTLPLAVMTSIGAYRYAEDTPRLVPYLKYDLWINVATPVLVAIGILIAVLAR